MINSHPPHPRDYVALVGFSCRALAQSVVRAGMRPLAIDCCGDCDLHKAAHQVSRVESLEREAEIRNQLVQWEKTFGAIPILFAGGMENRFDLLEELSPLYSNIPPIPSWRSMRDWESWKRWVDSVGLSFPRTCWLEDFDPKRFQKTTDRTSRVLLKPCDRAGGVGIVSYDFPLVRRATDIKLPPWPGRLARNSLCDSGRDARATYGNGKHLSADRLIEQRGDVGARKRTIVQEYVEGVSLGVTFISSDSGASALGATRSLPLEEHPWGEFIYQGSSGPVSLNEDQWSRLDRFAALVTRETGWHGLWQADFIVAEDWYLIEINPRWTAGMEILELASGLSLWRGETATFRERLYLGNRMLQKRILYADSDTRLSESEIESLKSGKGEFLGSKTPINEEYESYWFSDIPHAGEMIPQGAPICTMMSRLDEQA